MNCRICSNQLNKKNKSPLKGICIQDYRVLSPEKKEILLEGKLSELPRRILDSTNDPQPEVTQEFYDKHIASFKPTVIPERSIEVQLSDEDRKLLTQLRIKKARTIKLPLLVTDESMHPPTPKLEKTPKVSILLSEEDRANLEKIRAHRRFGFGPLTAKRGVTKAFQVRTWDDLDQYLEFQLLIHPA